MYRIRQVYLDYVGFKGAWFQDVHLPFFAPDQSSEEENSRKEAVLDSIISLTNGGGKTTLLSLIFSNFVPRQERFVQHLQKPHHHFKDYFDKYPGLILIELEKEEKAYGDVDLLQKLVIGQYVAIEESTGEAKRRFFGFTASAELGFEDVPSMSKGNLQGMDDVRKWINLVSKEPTFNSTETQSEWTKWLNSEEIGLDTWVINKQVDFCRAEGGIESYMQFASEKDFLKEFFYMVLPPSDAEEIREILSESLHKLRKRPEFERQKKLLNKLLHRLEPFSEEAGYFNVTESNLIDKTEEGKRLYIALKKRIEEKEISISSLSNLKKNSDDEVNRLLGHQHAIESKLEAAKSFYQDLEIGDLEKLLKQMDLDNAAYQKEEKITEAALIYQQKQIKEASIEDLNQTLQNAGQDLTPLKNARDNAAHAFKEKLKLSLEETRQNISIANEERKTCQQNQIDNNQEIAEKQSLSSSHIKEISRHEFYISERNRQLEQLQSDGVLSFSDIPEEVLVGLKLKEEELTDQIAKLNAERFETEKANEFAEEQRSNLKDKITGLRIEISSLEKEVSNGLIYKQRLQRNNHLFSIMGTDEFNPASQDLVLKLNSFTDRKKGEADQLRHEIIQIQEQISLIEETGSILSDWNMSKALTFLKDQGINQAEFYPDYLGTMFGGNANLSIEEKAIRISQKIESNPGKYLGIGVSKSDYEKLENSDLKMEDLIRPIQISEITRNDLTFEENSKDERPLVLKPLDPDLYTKESIERFLKELKEKSKEKEVRLAELSELNQALSVVQNQLADFQESYGEGKLEVQEERLSNLKEKCTAEEVFLEDLEQNQKQNRERLLELGEALVKANDDIHLLKQMIEKVDRYIQQYEKEFSVRSSRVEELASLMEKLDEEIISIKQSNLDLQLKQDQLLQKDTILNEELKSKRKTRDEIQLPDDFVSESSPDLSKAEEIYRVKYENAAKAIRQQESETGLGDVIARKEIIEEELSKIKEELHMAMEGLDIDSIGKKASISESELKESLKNLRHKSDKNKEMFGARQEALNRLKREKRDFDLNRKHKAATWLETDLDQEQVSTKISRLQSDHEMGWKEINEIQEEIKKYTSDIASETSNANESRILLDGLVSFSTIEDTELENIPSLPYEQSSLNSMISAFNLDVDEFKRKLENASYMAEKAYKKVLEVVHEEEFRAQEQRIAVEIEKNSFPEICHHVERHLRLTTERIEAITHEIEATQEDLDLCVSHLLNHSSNALTKLRFVTKKSNIPDTVPGMGGKKILKIRSDISTLTQEHKRSQIEIYVHELAESQMIPNVSNETGDELTAEIISALAKAKNREGKLGIEIIKLSKMVTYTPIDQIKGSGGESMTSALLLYLVLAQLRAESKADRKKAPGGFLMMDNPFSRATTPQLVKLQVELAKNLGFQLIYATAIKDFNAQSLFSHIVQLRQVAHDRANDRVLVNKIESAEFTTYS